jgi:hypothetical protein
MEVPKLLSQSHLPSPYHTQVSGFVGHHTSGMCELWVPRHHDGLEYDSLLPLGSIFEDGVSTHMHERMSYNRHGISTVPDDKSFGGFFGYYTYSWCITGKPTF